MRAGKVCSVRLSSPSGGEEGGIEEAKGSGQYNAKGESPGLPGRSLLAIIIGEHVAIRCL